MSRPLRIEFSNALYHVAALGDRREDKCLRNYGGRYWDRTSDPCRVKAVLYR